MGQAGTLFLTKGAYLTATIEGNHVTKKKNESSRIPPKDLSRY